MIARIEEAKNNVRRLIVLLLIGAGSFKNEIISYIIKDSKINDNMNIMVYTILYMAIIIGIFVVFEYLIEYNFSKLRFFRYFVMGPDSIEGIWLDVVYRDGIMVDGAVIQIRYRNNDYVMNGVGHHQIGNMAYKFHSDHTRYENRTLEFNYQSMCSQPERIGGGLGQYMFTGNRCTRFSGKFYEQYSTSIFRVRGIKLRVYLQDTENSLEDIKSELRDYVIMYHKRNLIGYVMRLFCVAPDLTPREEKVLIESVIRYYSLVDEKKCQHAMPLEHNQNTNVCVSQQE